MAYEYGITSQPHPIARTEAFDRLVLAPHMLGGTIATFWMNANFDVAGPWNFYLEWAEHPDSDFIDVAGPTTDNILIDPVQRRFSKLPHSVYRVRLEPAGGGLYYSPVNPVMGEWNYHQWKVVRDITRREYLRLQRYVGTQGVYLARKQWGELCDECLDYNTQMVTDANCETCYGTGFVGGYHTPSVLWIGEDRIDVRAKRDANLGVVADQTQFARVIALPFLTAKDVWVSLTTGERWIIQAKREEAAMQGKPIIYQVEMRLAETASVVYKIPIEPTSSSSSA